MKSRKKITSIELPDIYLGMWSRWLWQWYCPLTCKSLSCIHWYWVIQATDVGLLSRHHRTIYILLALTRSNYCWIPKASLWTIQWGLIFACFFFREFLTWSDLSWDTLNCSTNFSGVCLATEKNPQNVNQALKSKLILQFSVQLPVHKNLDMKWLQ